MDIEYHKHLDRILVRRAAETESLQRQVDSNQPGPKFVLAFFCFGIAGVALIAVPMLFPLWVLPALGGVIVTCNGVSVWRQVKHAEKSLSAETAEEEYRRYLLAKLGPKKFDQLAVAVGAGGSDASIRGWLKPLGFDDQDVEYLLWLAEALLETLRGTTLDVPRPRPAAPVADVAPPAAPAAPESVPAVPAAPESRLSDEELAKFRALAERRKREYEQWRASGGREDDPDDPFGKLKDLSSEKLAELKRKAQERRKQGAAPVSTAPAPGAKDHPDAFNEREIADLERRALARFEPRPTESLTPKEELLGEVFDPDEIARLKEKAERKSAARKASPPAGDNDPGWNEQS